MMRVIDVDAHFFEPFTWLSSIDKELADELTATLPPASFADNVFGEILANIPDDQREQFDDVDLSFKFLGEGSGKKVTPEQAEEMIEGTHLESVLRARGACDADERLAVNDEQSIDVQFLNPTTALPEYRRVYRYRRQRLGDFCEAYNTWATRTVEGHADRLVPVALIDLGDSRRAVQELTRMRAAGSRAYLLPLYPVDGKALSHPDHDDIWAATEDLGLVATMHVGAGHAIFDAGWMNTGRGNTAVAAFRMSGTLAPQSVQAGLTDLIVNGIFERHPGLIVLCSEFGLAWMRGWWERIGPTTHKVTVQTLLEWDLPLTAHEYAHRNVRVSPLPGDLIDRFIDDFGVDMLWFASDYPHPEGSASAVTDFDAQLGSRFDESVKRRFFGGGAEEFLARTA
jgi:predicted TIM-barrel fold metal-dependent hydrolase